MMLLNGALVKSWFDIMKLLIDILLGYNWQLVCVFGITKEIRSLPLCSISRSLPKLWSSPTNRKRAVLGRSRGAARTLTEEPVNTHVVIERRSTVITFILALVSENFCPLGASCKGIKSIARSADGSVIANLEVLSCA